MAKQPATKGTRKSVTESSGSTDIVQRMERLFDDFSRDWRLPSLFRDFDRLDPLSVPRLADAKFGEFIDVKFDIRDNEKAIRITAELPGIAEKDVDISIEDGVLTVKGEKKAEKEEKDDKHYLSERHYGSFSRSFRLPASVIESRIRADFDKGVLSISMPKKKEPASKRKKISIKSK